MSKPARLKASAIALSGAGRPRSRSLSRSRGAPSRPPPLGRPAPAPSRGRPPSSGWPFRPASWGLPPGVPPCGRAPRSPSRRLPPRAPPRDRPARVPPSAVAAPTAPCGWSPDCAAAATTGTSLWPAAPRAGRGTRSACSATATTSATPWSPRSASTACAPWRRRCPRLGGPILGSRLRLLEPHRQRDPLAVEVDLEHPDPHDVPGRDDVARVLHERRRQREMCTRPSWCTPMSTNAPNAATLVTTPSSTMPGLQVGQLLDALGEASRCERGARVAAGLLQLARMSVTVGRPKRSSTNSAGESCCSTAVLPISSPTATPGGRRRCAAPPGRPRGARRRRRAGRRRPGCAGSRRTARTPSGPAAAPPAAARRVRNGAVGVPVRHDLRGQPLGRSRTPVRSSGAEAVLTSTPTAFTQSSTTRVQRARQLPSVTSCWYWPDADRLRVDLDQLGQRVLQPAGDRDRAAQRHVQLGQLARGVGRRRVHRRPGLGLTITLVSFSSGCASHQLGGQLVGLARGGAVADRDQLDAVRLAPAREPGRASRPTAWRGSCG